MYKKIIKEVSIKLSPSKGDMSKRGKTTARGMYSTCSPTEERLSHTTFQDLKEKMTVPVAQVPYIPLEPAKGNTQVGKIKGNFGYNFSNPAKLGELRDEVTGEKIHGLTKSQMRLRKQGYYDKGITSSHHTSVEKTNESKEGKTPRWTSVFDRIERLTPRVFAFERLVQNAEQVEGDATTSKAFVFHRLGAKRKSLSGKTLLEQKIKIFVM
ncbi:hypothetical protein H5410_046546 [Solanum commersonii]|uniref:Uncharacterized protein n=1 Tax=Solanum commersonii TaxID=4109 RepID=A0A9J5XGS7_SOLCO|nr:hypothetical protein H5410_046546 [Solanum commersonii]